VIWLGALVIGLAAGLLTGGSIENFARIKFRWPLIVLAGVVVREIVLLTPFGRVEGAEYVYVAALAAIVTWTILHLAGPLLSRGTIGQYTLMGAGTNLNFLGDWISIGPIREAYSPGDLMIALGIALVVFLGVRSPKVVTQTDIGS
jgi:hypothetical protein